MLYICLDCDRTFRTPIHYVETHNLNTPPYEEYDVCPFCGGAYVEAHECDECGRWIIGEYIKTTSGQRICENCYTVMEIGEED